MFYKILGGVSIALLALAVALTFHVLTGKHEKKVVVIIAGSVFAILITISLFSWIIFSEFHP